MVDAMAGTCDDGRANQETSMPVNDPLWMSPSDLRREVVRLREAVRQHRDVWDSTVGRWDTRRDDANDDLWAVLDDKEPRGGDV